MIVHAIECYNDNKHVGVEIITKMRLSSIIYINIGHGAKI